MPALNAQDNLCSALFHADKGNKLPAPSFFLHIKYKKARKGPFQTFEGVVTNNGSFFICGPLRKVKEKPLFDRY
jgi:hypothetical protein